MHTMLEIVHEGAGFIAVNKPPRLLSEPTEKGGSNDQHLLQLLGQQRPKLKEHLFLCHRLDRETSGLLLVATTHKKAAWLNELFRERRIKKTYLALCHGIPGEKTWEIKCNLSAINRQTGRVRRAVSGGRPSHTSFELVSQNDAHSISLIRCHPFTGRSHQLRVHLQLSGMPILGDKKYKDERRFLLPNDALRLTAGHQLLHAETLTFQPGPKEREITLTARPPENFAALTAMLGL